MGIRPSNPEFLTPLIEKIKRSLPVAVVHGGNRNAAGAVIQRTRNPRSEKDYVAVATDIANALRRLGFEQVHLIPEDMRMAGALKELNVGLVWLNSGGTQGFSSTCHAPSIMELCGVPYIGHNPMNAALLDNKHCFKYALNGLHINTPEFVVCDFKNPMQIADVSDRFDAIFSGCRYLVVKPVSGRASLNVYRAHGKKEALDIAKSVHEETGNLVLIERFMSGDEYTIAVNGPCVSVNRKLIERDSLFAFSAIRRVMGDNEPIFTSMDVRPIGPDRCQILDPGLDSGIVDALASIAGKVYMGFNLGTMVRVDIRSDEDGRLFVLEANPKPDLKKPSATGFSFVSAGLHKFGMDYDDLILSILVDRVHVLLSRHKDMIPQIVELL